MTINTLGKQQELADYLAKMHTAFTVGIVNEFEFAGKVLAMLEAIETDQIREAKLDEHLCPKDEWGNGTCDHPSHDYELIEQRPQSQSEAFRLATS